MKNNNFNSIVKASLKSRKLSSGMFCFFVAISFVLIFIAIGIIVPLGQNIETKINRHIIKREIGASMSYTTNEEERQRRIDKIMTIPHVVDMYEDTSLITMSETNGVLSESYIFRFVHRFFDLRILNGRAFDESESGVALVPAYFEEYNAKEQMIVKINGEDLVGQTLEFCDWTGVPRKTQIVGTYDNTDPIFNSKRTILIPYADAVRYDEEAYEYEVQNAPEGAEIRRDHHYIIVTDSHRNTRAVLEEAQKVTTCCEEYLNIDEETYNTAFIILLAVTVFFTVLTVLGFYMFLKSNINARTNELALYRAIGYNSKALYRIIFAEHLLLTACSLAFGVGAYYLLAHFAVNPYLDSMFGSTFMAITVSNNPLIAVVLIIGYILVTLLVCRSAVKRTEKIDLTVLLRE